MVLPASSKTQNSELFLYSGIIESHLGKRASAVALALYNYGRLNIKELAKRSGLPVVLVKKALVSLIQLKCVSVWQDSSYKGTTTYYSFRDEGVLLMLYSGEIIAHIEDIFNDDYFTQIVQNFLSLGGLSTSEYLSSFGTQDAQTRANIEERFTTLVQQQYLIPVKDTHFQPTKDIWKKTYHNALSKVPKAPMTSELRRTAEAKAIAKVDFLNLLSNEPEGLYLKDKATLTKRVNPAIPLAFNLQRFLKARRTLQLVQLCSHRVGKLTSVIYKQALMLNETNAPDVSDPLLQIGLTNEEVLYRKDYEPKTGQIFAAKDLVGKLPKDLNLKGSILSGPAKRKADVDDSSRKRVKLNGGSYGVPDLNNDDDDDADDADDDFELVGSGNSLAIVEQHLKLLTKSGIPFIKKASGGSYYIPYPDLMSYIKKTVLESVVTATLGAPSARVLRCVRDNRLVSEKLINSVALLREKDARSLTSVLVKHNLLHIQEVPKSADRAASKSVFLYRVNDKHCFDTMKNNMCWNMGRLLERGLVLKLENSALVSKINREDVKGKELEYLLPSELTQLKKMKDEELTLAVKMHRLMSLWEIFKLF
ncbi:CYFA0S03e06524g1_1 [Cyberlindnera fabianii]|uniref:DNA-directed RNA polymerase III subunit RPC3 n=1 Tax=Cyberlindnera fabianii TaxID=36022 RepID=A0A061ARD6_CYBFA|nr:CYFA0S03e06524g1_1 [Cyberlindnera fabianii]